MKPLSKRHKDKISKTLRCKGIKPPKMFGDSNPMKRQEVQLKVSKKLMGKNNPMKRIDQRQRVSIQQSIRFKTDANPMRRPEVRDKISGSNSYIWKGGKKAMIMRQHQRRRQLGCNLLNEPFEKSVGHHLNRKDILNIPEELHKSVIHSLENQESMSEINQIALEWYFEQNVSNNRPLIEGDI